MVLMLLLLVSSSSMAQTMMSVPYSMDFEEADSTEIANWVFNPGSTAAFKETFVIGSATHSAGRRALYISYDGGKSAEYTVAKNVQYAYRDFMLPAGKYDLTFDWKNHGSSKSTLSAGYALASQMTAMTGTNTSATIPTAILNKCNTQMKQNFGFDDWQNTSFQIQSNGTAPTRVFFVWSNSETDSTKCGLGACIDNIQITSIACQRPSNLQVTTKSCDEVLLTWAGASTSYEVAYRQVGSDVWNSCYNVTVSGNVGTATFNSMNEGSYDFRVRGICTPDTSAWSYYSGFVVYCEELHCINFTDLHGKNVVCTYGTTTYSEKYSGSKQNAYATRGVVDFGSDDIRSRHTVNSDLTAMDPRTNNQLPLVPKGSKFSVRLGNWETSYGAEAISYTYTVDSTKSIVLLQYAVVLQDPDHSADEQPRFVLEILDEQGHMLDATCGMRNFVPQKDWVTVGTGYEKVTFKPWTTVGLNVGELGVQDGEKITVRLTTYDCFQGGHYGYAYFTLDCASPTIQTLSCAKDESATAMVLTAPAGFKYQWLNNQHKPILGATEPEFAPKDTATYYCRLTSTENATCVFELESQCVPRLPIPEYELLYTPHDCMNELRVRNTSHPRIVLQDRTIEQRDSRCDTYSWRFWGDNYPEQHNDRDSFLVSLPQAGGTYYVELTASLNGGCDSTMIKKITIPEIGESVVNSTATLCEHGSVVFFEDVISYEDIQGQDTTIERGGKSFAGCDSLVTLYIYKAPSYLIKLDTMDVYEGGTFEFAGEEYKVTESKMYMANLHTVDDCDSLVMQFVRLVPCYNLVYQRWNDVLSVMNESAQQAKGMKPVTCLSYQWMKDHMPIEGETDSYYYVPEGLEEGHIYTVLITLESGEQYETCDLYPQLRRANAPEQAHKVLRDGRLYIQQGDVRMDMLGNKYVCK